MKTLHVHSGPSVESLKAALAKGIDSFMGDQGKPEKLEFQVMDYDDVMKPLPESSRTHLVTCEKFGFQSDGMTLTVTGVDQDDDYVVVEYCPGTQTGQVHTYAP